VKQHALFIPITSSILLHLGLIALVLFNADFLTEKPQQNSLIVPTNFSENKKQQNHYKPAETVAIDSKQVDDLANRIRKKKQAEEDRRRALEKKLAELEAKQRRESAKTQNAITQRKKADEEAKESEKKRKDAKAKALEEEKKRLLAEKERIEQEQAAQRATEKNKQESLLLEQKRKEREVEEAKAKVLAQKREQDELNRKRQQELEQQMLEEQKAITAEHQKFVISEVEKYQLWIRDKIRGNLNEGVDAVVRLRLAPGGLVIDANCIEGADIACRDALIAVKKSEPLPVSQDKDVFAKLRDIRLKLNKIVPGVN